MTFDSAYPMLARPDTVVPWQGRRWLTGVLALFNTAIIMFDLTLFVR